MLNNVETKNNMADALIDRVSAIVDIYNALDKEGYIPNKTKKTKVMMFSIMLDAVNNINILPKAEQYKINQLYNKTIMIWQN